MGQSNLHVDEWYRRWHKPVRSWLRNRASIPVAHIDDLSHEVFMRLLRYESDEPVDNVQGYLFRIAANVANEWRVRSRNKQPHADEWLEDLEDSAGNETEEIDWNRHVRAVIGRLKARQQEILWMHIDGLTYKQIAKRLGITYRIVLRDLTRAYAFLRMELKSEHEGR